MSTVTFQFNASLLNKGIQFFKNQKIKKKLNIKLVTESVISSALCVMYPSI